jgi:2-methylcitrate dehydratase PrpD
MYVTEMFARHAQRFLTDPLPAAALHHAKRAVIDWSAAVFPGFDTLPVQLLLETVSEDLDRGTARLATGRSATVRAAALVNGTAAHAAEVDDSFREAMYHPGAATIAGALAVAQAQNADGLQFLRAVVLGYEVSTRIGMVMGRAHYEYWHNTGTVGIFGAAAAAAGVLRLDEAAFANALATAATFSAGLQQAFRLDSMSKPFHAGRAAEGGVLAAQLAARGVTGSLDIFEGDVGFGKALGKGPDWSHVVDTLGLDYNVTRLTFKNHIGCGHAFPAIDGALALRREHAIAVADIAHVRIATYKPALDIACYGRPSTVKEAKFSIPYVVAQALVHGSVRMAAYEPAQLEDPRTRSLMDRIEVTVDPEIDAAFPGRRSARVTITMRDGRRFEHFQADRKGDPELPLDDDDLESKLLELAEPVIGRDAAGALRTRLWALDTSPAGSLMNLFST